MNMQQLNDILNDILNNGPHDLKILIDLNIIDFKNLLTLAKSKNIKLCYYYDIISCLYDFKINKNSISCYDIKGNKIYLKYNSKYLFFTNCITIDN